MPTRDIPRWTDVPTKRGWQWTVPVQEDGAALFHCLIRNQAKGYQTRVECFTDFECQAKALRVIDRWGDAP